MLLIVSLREVVKCKTAGRYTVDMQHFNLIS